MRWRWCLVLQATVLVVLCTGCPEDYMPGGKLDQAMDKDLKARLHDNVNQCKPGEHVVRLGRCPPGQTCFECVKDK